MQRPSMWTVAASGSTAAGLGRGAGRAAGRRQRPGLGVGRPRRAARAGPPHVRVRPARRRRERPAAGPTTPGEVADTLAAALDASGLDGPFVFVGHSLAGPTVRQLGATHPELLAGAVLLDPTTKMAFAAVRSDLEQTGWDYDATVAEANAPVTWPDVTLVVLSHDPALLSIGPEAVEQLWTEGQQEYAALTPDGTQEAVTGSSHYVYRDAPDRVVEAIGSVTP